MEPFIILDMFLMFQVWRDSRVHGFASLSPVCPVKEILFSILQIPFQAAKLLKIILKRGLV